MSVVPVLLLLRDNEEYCATLLPRVLAATEEAARARGWRARFFVYDNSTDGTPQRLERLTARHDLVVRSEPLPKHLPRGGDPISTTRCSRIAWCRNTLMAMVPPDTLLHAPRVVLIDSDIDYDAATLGKLFAATGRSGTIGMATACTVEDWARGHYYDTYAYTPEGADLVHEKGCPLEGCGLCRNRGFKLRSAEAVRVRSAFGGLAVTRPLAIAGATWSSADDACEHVAFCDGVHDNGYDVVIVPDAVAVRRHLYPSMIALYVVVLFVALLLLCGVYWRRQKP